MDGVQRCSIESATLPATLARRLVGISILHEKGFGNTSRKSRTSWYVVYHILINQVVSWILIMNSINCHRWRISRWWFQKYFLFSPRTLGKWFPPARYWLISISATVTRRNQAEYIGWLGSFVNFSSCLTWWTFSGEHLGRLSKMALVETPNKNPKTADPMGPTTCLERYVHPWSMVSAVFLGVFSRFRSNIASIGSTVLFFSRFCSLSQNSQLLNLLSFSNPLVRLFRINQNRS